MSDELLAMLEPKSQKFSIGRGGVPALTVIDIAAALGMGADKFCAAAFQITRGGSLHGFEQFDEMLAGRQFGEWRERAERMVDAQLAVAVSAGFFAKLGGRAYHAKMMLDGARAAMWPALNDYEGKYKAVRRAVVAELRMPRTCPVCTGKKFIQIDDGPRVECAECHGEGNVPISGRQRSLAIQVDASRYTRVWRKVYEWTYRCVADAATAGRSQFNEALE